MSANGGEVKAKLMLDTRQFDRAWERELKKIATGWHSIESFAKSAGDGVKEVASETRKANVESQKLANSQKEVAKEVSNVKSEVQEVKKEIVQANSVDILPKTKNALKEQIKLTNEIRSTKRALESIKTTKINIQGADPDSSSFKNTQNLMNQMDSYVPKGNPVKAKLEEIQRESEKTKRKLISDQNEAVQGMLSAYKDGPKLMYKLSPDLDREELNRAIGEAQAFASTRKVQIGMDDADVAKLKDNENSIANFFKRVDGMASNSKVAFSSYQKTLRDTGDEGSRTASKMSQAGDGIDKASAGANRGTSAFRMLHRASFMLEIAGGVMVGLFGFNLFTAFTQAATSSMTAKQEMMGLFNQLNWGNEQIKLVTDSLTEMNKEYRKINKWQIGAIVANVATMGNLNAEETAQLVPSAGLIYETYRRGGRTPEEARLSIQEIAEGEFMRLSRETGVGKEDLLKTGKWSGDLNDKVGMFKAIEEVGKSKHWDTFAAKISTIDDAVQTLGNSFGELLVILGDIFLPLLANLAIAVSTVIYTFSDWWNELGDGGRIFVLVFAIGSLIGLLGLATFLFLAYTGVLGSSMVATLGLSGALAVYIANAIVGIAPTIALTFATQGLAAGFYAILISLLPMVVTIGAVIAVIAILAYAIFEVGKALGWWKDMGSMGEAIWVGIVNVLTQVYNALVWVADAFGIFDGLEWIYNQLIGPLTSAWNAFIDALKGAKGADTSGFMESLKMTVLVLAGAFKLIVGSVMSAIGWLNNFANSLFGIEGTGNLIYDSWNRLKVLIGGIVGIAQAIYGAFKSAADAIAWVFGAISGGLGAIGSFISGGVQSIGGALMSALFGDDGGKNAGNWIMDWLGSIDWNGMIMGFIGTLITLFAHYNPATLLMVALFGEDAGMAMQENIMLILWAIVDQFIAFFEWLIESVTFWSEVFNQIWTAIWFVLGEVWNFIYATLVAVWNLIVQTAYAIWNPLYAWFLWLWNGINSTAQWVWNNIVMTIYNALVNVWNTVVSIGQQIWTSFSSAMAKVWGVVSPYVNMIQGAWNGLRDSMVGAANYVNEKVTGAFKGVEDALKRVWNWITHPFGAGSSDGAGGAGAGPFMAGAGLPGAGPSRSPRRSSRRSGGAGAGGMFDWVTEGANNMVQSTTGIYPGAGFGRDEELAEEYFGCNTQRECQNKGYGAGPWDFGPSMAKSIIDKVMNWTTNIGGTSFSVSDLSKGGSMSLFRALATKLISGTSYQFYYGDGKSNQQAMKDKSFNCFDGAQILVALANAFGLGGSLVNGYWGSTPHTWASINGVAFDTTAFQHGYGWTGPAQRGAGPSSSYSSKSVEINIEVPINAPVYDEGGLIRMIKRAVGEQLNDVADNLFV